MNKPLVGLLVVPLVVLIAGFRLHGLFTAAPAGETPNEKIESVYTATAVMPRESFLRLSGLRSRLANASNPTLTDAEVYWLLQTRRGGSPTKPYAASIARARPLEVLLMAKLTPAQKNRVYQAVLPDLQSRDKWGAVPDRLRACDALQTLHETRALPHLRPLLQHPNARVRTRAQQTLEALGDAAVAKTL